MLISFFYRLKSWEREVQEPFQGHTVWRGLCWASLDLQFPWTQTSWPVYCVYAGSGVSVAVISRQKRVFLTPEPNPLIAGFHDQTACIIHPCLLLSLIYYLVVFWPLVSRDFLVLGFNADLLYHLKKLILIANIYKHYIFKPHNNLIKEVSAVIIPTFADEES